MRTAKDVLERAGIILLDESYVRWEVAELAKWLNDGLLAIVVQKPSATAQTITIPLVEGTLQTLQPGQNSILRPVRNVRGEKSDRMPRKVLTVVGVESINALKPDWHDPYSVRYAQQVKHFIFDEANPRAFYVYPGNDGTGYMEAVISVTPQPISPSGEPDELESYAVPLSVDDIYFNALLYFVLHRAYSKDAQVAGAAQRAVMYYQQYANELGIQVTVETNMSPNAKAGVGGGAVGVTQ